MISNPGLAWAFSIGFSVIAAYLLWRAIAERKHVLQVIGHVLHAMMALVMVAMAWKWWWHLPWWPQLLFFGAATVWFVAMAVLRGLKDLSGEDVVGHTALHQVIHAAMMASMFWMVLVMPPSKSPFMMASDTGGHDHGHGDMGHDHGDMGGHDHGHGDMGHGSHDHSGMMAQWELASGWIFVTLLAVAAVYELVEAIRHRRGDKVMVADHVVMTFMLAGMSWMCALML